MKRVLIGALFFLFSVNVFSQKLTAFTPDSIKFLKELDKYFQDNSANKDDAAAFIENLGKFWKTPAYSILYKNYVYTTSNKMLEKKLKPYPYFQNYLIAVANFINSKQDVSIFDAWQSLLDKIITKNKNPKPFNDFLEMSDHVFESGMFYKGTSCQWYTNGSNYKFDYDSIPKLVFNNVTLSGSNPRGDSINIENTSGTYYPTSGHFYGKGGLVSWKRTGLAGDVFADVKKYNIDCKSGGYVTDSAIFHNTQYFDKPQTGRLTDKIISENGKPTYPRFDTYTKRLEIKGVIKDVFYDGGFSMRGAQFVGSGDVSNPAKVVFKRNNQRFLEVSARNFIMATDKITADNAAVKFYLDKDSISHPACDFKYLADQRKVSLVRNEQGIQKTPFYDSYHKLDMYFEELVWKIDSPKIDIGFLAANFQGQAYFESQDFFTAERYDAIKGQVADVNPVAKINQYYEQNGKLRSFTAVDLAKYMKWLAIDLRPILIKIAGFGLINYNPETDEIIIKDKLFNYIKASRKLADYDVLTFHSVLPGQTNASINLLNNNFDMRVHGVKQILLSDTQKVFVFPKAGEIVVKKGRGFTFNGIVASGKFEYHGKEFSYDYDQNKVNLKQVDSLRIYVTALEPEPDGSIPFKRVQTVVENITGELDVDNPKNHSGRLDIPQNPIFKSFKYSYAF